MTGWTAGGRVAPRALDDYYLALTGRLVERMPAHFTAVRLEGLDTVGHYFLRFALPQEFGDVSDDERARFGRVMDQYYAALDAEVGRLLQQMRPDDLLLVVSPFGLEPLSVPKRLLEQVLGNPAISGTHERAPDGFLLAYGADVQPGRYPRGAVVDFAPTLLYYFGLFVKLDAYAARHGLKGLPRAELPSLLTTVKEGWYYLAVIALLIYMLLVMKRESHAPFFATVLLLVLNQLFNTERWTWGTLMRFLELNGRTFVELVGILAGCGLLIGAFSLTGVISSLANDMLALAGGSALLLLALAAITSLVLGLGLTTTACYIFLAILVGPALEKAGLNKMAVHMFVFYWGMLSSITPPVAIASFAAAGIAGAAPMKTAWESMIVGSIIYFIPFFFVLNPAFVLQGPWWETAWLCASAVLGIVFICAALQGWQLGIGDLASRGALQWPLRLALAAGGMLLAAPGGGIMPLGHLEMLTLAGAILVPTLALALWAGRGAAIFRQQ